MMAAIQRQGMFILERINDSQKTAWSKAIEVFEGTGHLETDRVIPQDRLAPVSIAMRASIRFERVWLRRPRQRGADDGGLFVGAVDRSDELPVGGATGLRAKEPAG